MPEVDVLDDFSNWLKTLYLQSTWQQFKKQTVFLDEGIVTRDSEDVSGNNAIFGVSGLSFAGTGARAEGGTFPTGRRGRFQKVTVTMAYNYVSMGFSGQVLAASRNKEGAFEDVMDAETTQKMAAFFMDINRQLLWDGSAVLALVDGTPNLTTQVITIDAAGGLADDTNGGLFLSEDCDIDIYSSSGTYRGRCQITAMTDGSGSSTSATITVDAVPSGTGDGDYIYRAGNKGNEFTGVYGFCATSGTLFSLSSTTMREWRGTKHTGATAGTAEALTQLRLEKWESEVYNKTGYKIQFCVGNEAAVWTYGDLVARGGVMPNRVKLGLTAWEGLDWGGRPMIVEPFAPGAATNTNLFGIVPEIYKIHQMNNPDWITDGRGGILRLNPNDTDSFIARFGWYALLAPRVRRACAQLSDIKPL